MRGLPRQIQRVGRERHRIAVAPLDDSKWSGTYGRLVIRSPIKIAIARQEMLRHERRHTLWTKEVREQRRERPAQVHHDRVIP